MRLRLLILGTAELEADPVLGGAEEAADAGAGAGAGAGALEGEEEA